MATQEFVRNLSICPGMYKNVYIILQRCKYDLYCYHRFDTFFFHNIQNSFLTIVAGEWGAWGNWSECTVTCDGGESTRTRLCNDPLPLNGGDYCIGNETLVDRILSNGTMQQRENKTCNENICSGGYYSKFI